jgi:hypothetical protein
MTVRRPPSASTRGELKKAFCVLRDDGVAGQNSSGRTAFVGLLREAAQWWTSSVFSPSSGEAVIVGPKPENLSGVPTVG